MVDKTHDAKESLADFGERTADRTRLLSQRARVQARTTADESPLLLALGLLGVGALIGAAIPTSRREDELMGPVRDNLLEQAKSKGQEVAHKVSRIAEVATSEAGRATDESKGDAGEKIVAAVEGAVSGARLEAERQGLSTSHDDGDGRLATGSRSTPAKDGTSSVTSPRASSERSFGLPSDALSGLSGTAGTSGTSGTAGTTGSPVRRASSGGPTASEIAAPSRSSTSPSGSTLGSSSSGISSPRTASASSSPSSGSSGSSWSSPSTSGSSTSTRSTSGLPSSSGSSAMTGPDELSSPGAPSERSGRRPARGGNDETSKEPRR
jgi:hypothetical protein